MDTITGTITATAATPTASTDAAPSAWRAPSRAAALDFWWRSRLLAAAHAVRQTLRPSARRWSTGDTLLDAPVLAEHRSPLWADGRADEFALVAGKVHNLRVARPAFHAIEVPAGEAMSFWRQLGRPRAGRGFVEGREVREGCVVPTLAGGICQISNALATVASKAGFELLERHAHSARIEGSSALAETIDATVFWNYIDLRVRASHPWRLELELGASELVLRVRGRAGLPARSAPVAFMPPPTRAGAAPVARGCTSCDQTACFRHRPAAPSGTQGRTALLLDAASPEFAAHLAVHHAGADRFVPVPMRLAFWRPVGPSWDGDGHRMFRAHWASARRALWQRWWAQHAGGRRQASLIDGQRWLAAAYAARLSPAHTRLVIDQALLPHLERLGVLGGRQVEVLAGALPMREIEARLDAAARRWPDDATLRDFRVDRALADAEQRGFAQAASVVTAHAAVAAAVPALTRATVQLLSWTLPDPVRSTPSGGDSLPLIVFPASGLARKGWRELEAALHGLEGRYRLQTAVRWSDEWASAAALVLPAHVEHAPRALLRALVSGVPVIATPACGLGERPGVRTVPAGDVEALRAALAAVLRPSPTAGMTARGAR